MLPIKVILCIIIEYQACHTFIHEWFPNDDPKTFIQKRNEHIIELLRNPRSAVQEHIDIYDEDSFVIKIFGKWINFTPLFVKFK